jgi:hypothetical protein
MNIKDRRFTFLDPIGTGSSAYDQLFEIRPLRESTARIDELIRVRTNECSGR